jgi:7-cyano-7-deazaguanine synthase
MKVTTIFSGGLDSTTLVYQLFLRKDSGIDEQHLVSFNYGQRHSRELLRATNTAFRMGLEHTIVDLSLSGLLRALRSVGSNSSLITNNDVPEGHYADENMRSTVVPNRNMMMLSIAGAIAAANGSSYVAAGVHSGDHPIYPDCRPEFWKVAGNALREGNLGYSKLQGVLTPFMGRTKAEIAYEALMIGVPLHETWSCYKGGEKHCGRCGTCVERLEAIHEAQGRYWERTGQEPPADLTQYEDADYWREQVAFADEGR